MNQYATGNEIRCRFCFTVRELTTAEEANFLKGSGLPSGVGYDPPAAKLIYTPPEGEPTTLEGAAIVKDGVGAYHVILTTEDSQQGPWKYKGRGYNSEGKPIATSLPKVFTSTDG